MLLLACASPGAVTQPVFPKAEPMTSGGSTQTISVHHVEVRSPLSPQQVHERLLAVEGRSVHVYQYEIGNPLTAESMIRYQAGAGQYAPLRVVLYEEGSGSVIAYDRPSDLFGQFGDERITKVGHDLDRELEELLHQALGN